MTPKDYLAKCRDHGALMGYAPSNYPVLKKAEHPEQWRMWRLWYRSHGFHASVDLMSGDKREKTVPAWSPIEFEPGWMPSQKDFDPPPFVQPGEEGKQYVQDKLREAGLRYMHDGVLVDPERAVQVKVSDETFERSNARWDMRKAEARAAKDAREDGLPF